MSEIEAKRKEPFIHSVIPCHDSKFKNIECLESEKQYGFQTDPHDFRPAWHTWIDKEDAEKLYKLFVEMARKECIDKLSRLKKCSICAYEDYDGSMKYDADEDENGSYIHEDEIDKLKQSLEENKK